MITILIIHCLTHTTYTEITATPLQRPYNRISVLEMLEVYGDTTNVKGERTYGPSVRQQERREARYETDGRKKAVIH